MKNLKLIIFILFLLSFVACQNNPDIKSREDAIVLEVKDVTEVEGVMEVFLEDTGDRDPLDEELSEFGLVSLIEDSAYPFYYLLMEFPERQMEIYFKVNRESLNYSGSSLEELKGKYISFYYSSDLVNEMSDVLVNGVSLLGEYGYQDEEMRSITGILTNAIEESQGDVPGSITVTSEDGIQLSFEYYISEEIVAKNNSEVTVYYSEKPLNQIT